MSIEFKTKRREKEKGGERDRGSDYVDPKELLYPIVLWNAHGRTSEGMTRTNNRVEGFHNSMQSSVTNIHPNVWKLIDLLSKQDILSDKKKTYIELGQKSPNSIPLLRLFTGHLRCEL